MIYICPSRPHWYGFTCGHTCPLFSSCVKFRADISRSQKTHTNNHFSPLKSLVKMTTITIPMVWWLQSSKDKKVRQPNHCHACMGFCTHTYAHKLSPSLELEPCGLLLLRPLPPQLFGTLRLSTASQFGFYVMPAFLSSLQPILCTGSVGRNTRNLTVSFPVHGAIILVDSEERETRLLLSFSLLEEVWAELRSSIIFLDFSLS